MQNEPFGRTQQDAVRERLSEGAQQAAAMAQSGRQAMAETWQGAQSPGERLVLVGAAAGLISFFLPWMEIRSFFSRGGFSGFAMARLGYTAYWLFPIAMGFALYLFWLNLKGDRAQRLRGSRLHLMIGSGWAWYLFLAAGSPDWSLAVGGYVALVATGCIAVGAWLQNAAIAGGGYPRSE
jgi:hypothetical protein